MVAPSKRCRDCGSATRPAPHPGRRCTTCHRAVHATRRVAAHDKRIQDTYGLNPGEYALILAAQGGVCATCLKPFVRKRGSTDHDHAIEREFGARASVRGIIHAYENTIIGRFGDDPEWFERVAEYLRDPPAPRVLMRGEPE